MALFSLKSSDDVDLEGNLKGAADESVKFNPLPRVGSGEKQGRDALFRRPI
jgi:hypothetical protein